MPEPADARPLFRGRWIQVDEESWPGAGTWEVVRPLDAACVLPITPDGDVLLVRQFRAAVRKEVLEIPAGLLDVEGEDPAGCAARELLEETGFRHGSIDLVARIHPSPGFSTELIHIFVARTHAEPEAPAEDGIELVRVPLADAVADARAGRLEDGKTALALLLADAAMSPG